MHFSVTTPGFWFETSYITLSVSLSEITTVPALKELPAFDVWLEKASRLRTQRGCR